MIKCTLKLSYMYLMNKKCVIKFQIYNNNNIMESWEHNMRRREEKKRKRSTKEKKKKEKLHNYAPSCNHLVSF